MKILSLTRGLLVAASALCTIDATVASEVEIEFRYFADNSGQTSFVQKLNAEEHGGGIEASIEVASEVRDARVSLPEFDQLILMMRENVAQFEFEAGIAIPPPYIEIHMTYSGNDQSIKLTKMYPEGETPFPYVQMQQRYFQRILQ